MSPIGGEISIVIMRQVEVDCFTFTDLVDMTRNGVP
jgi:hypothetical protein